MSKKILLSLAVFALALGLAGCGQKEAEKAPAASEEKAVPAAKKAPTAAKTNENKNISTKPSAVKEEREAAYIEPSKIADEAAENKTAVTADDIKVTSPEPGETIPSPFLIAGEARSDENQVYVKLIRDDGRVIMDEFSTRIKGADAGEWGDFNTSPWYSVTHSEEANLEVYTKDEDGEIASKAVVPVKFESADEDENEE